MDRLIEALQIFLKYDNPRSPTHCEHDTLYVCIDPLVVSESDIEKLAVLGFHVDEEEECFYSFEFGSA